MATGSPTGRIPSRSEFDEDDEVLDQAIEAVRFDADVLGQCAPAVCLELALGQQLGAAVDRRHGRSQLVRQDVEERLAVGLVDQPALRRGPGGIGPRAVGLLGRSDWDSSRLIGRHHVRIVACGWVTQAHRRPALTLRVRRANVTESRPKSRKPSGEPMSRKRPARFWPYPEVATLTPPRLRWLLTQPKRRTPT